MNINTNKKNTFKLYKNADGVKEIVMFAFSERTNSYVVQKISIRFGRCFKKKFSEITFHNKEEAVAYIEAGVTDKIEEGFVDKADFKHEYVKCWDSENDEILYIFEIFQNGSYEMVASFNAFHLMWDELCQKCMDALNVSEHK